MRPVSGATDAYEIIAGERRWRAAQKAGLHDVPVLIREATDKESLELAIIENVQRADLNAIEEAHGYQQLIDQYSYTQEELAGVIGKSRSHIANTLRLLNLPEAVHIYILDGRLTAGHARALLTLDDPLAGARRILEEGLSRAPHRGDRRGRRTQEGRRRAQAREGRRHARAGKIAVGSAGAGSDDQSRAGKGAVQIKYTSLEQLDDVCRRLRG